MAGERLDHRAAHEVVGAELEAARHRQVAVVESKAVVVEALPVLVVRRAYPTNRRNAETDQVALGTGRIALEVALQPALALRHGELVVRPREVIHANVQVALARQ